MRMLIAAAALLAFASWPHAASAQLEQTIENGHGTRSLMLHRDAVHCASLTPHCDTAHRASLAPIVVTAARGPQGLPDALPQTTLFNRRDIQDSGAIDLAGLLQFAPGVQITRNGGAGQTAGLFMRGASSAQTLVMIDGVRVDSASLGATQIAQIPLDQLERVEVVSGNVSALYGSNAIGGVVQVFTRDGGRYSPRFTLDGEYGSAHTQRQHVGVNGAFDAAGATTFSIDVSRFKTEGFPAIDLDRATVDANRATVNSNTNDVFNRTNANGAFNESVSASLKQRFGVDWDAGIRYFQAFAKTRFDNPFGLLTDLNDKQDRVGQVSAFVNGKPMDRWRTHLTVAQGVDRSQILTNGQQTSHYDTTNSQLDWQNDYVIDKGHKLLFGYQRVNQALDASAFTTPVRRVNSGYVGYNGVLGRSEVQLNLRRDQYSDIGDANSYFIGYGYRFTDHCKAIVNYSSAFRAPTFDDLYYPSFGDPDLQPERAHSIEAALQYALPARGVARVTAFQTRYRNLIQYALADNGLYIAQNVGRAKVEGIEASWSGHVGRTGVRASATLQHPVDELAHHDLPRRPRRFASVSAHHPFGSWQVGGQWLLTGSRQDNGQPLGGYGVVNLSARYAITKSWHVAARVDNLFNKDYEMIYAYNTPRRGAYFTLGWRQL